MRCYQRKLINENHLIKKCKHSDLLIVEGVITELNGNKEYFIDEASLEGEEEVTGLKYKKLEKFKWEF